MHDVALANAQIIWHADEGVTPPVKVMDRDRDRDDDRYSASSGSCNMDFNEASDAEKLLMLFLQFHQMVTTDELAPTVVHDAFMQIPEYRRAVANFGTVNPINAADDDDD